MALSDLQIPTGRPRLRYQRLQRYRSHFWHFNRIQRTTRLGKTKRFYTYSGQLNFLFPLHILGLKVILDFVPNHSSDQHEWFIKSENKIAGYENYYVWKDGTPTTPPNNWVSNSFYSHINLL